MLCGVVCCDCYKIMTQSVKKAASKAIDPSKCEESRDESEWNGIKNAIEGLFPAT